MTEPRGSIQLGALGADVAPDVVLRRAGRQLANACYAALRAVRLYPAENAAVQKAMLDVVQTISEILRREGDCELKVSSDVLFLNGTRLRLDLDNYASFSQVQSLFRTVGIGSLRCVRAPLPRDCLVLFAQLPQVAALPMDPSARLEQLVGRLDAASVRGFEFAPPAETADEARQRDAAADAAKRAYAQGLAVTREAVNAVRLGKGANLRRIKRVVQTLVDQVLADDTSLIGLTTLRDYDDYTFVHSVNVCILAVALGRRLGLGKVQLYDLGVAALLHDIGKARVPLDVLNKAGGLTDAEWRMVAAHPWLGVLALLQLKGQQELPYRALTVCYEHHMKADLSGYPRNIRPRAMSIYSKIVAVADAFDAATSERVYQHVPMSPADALSEMRDNPRRGMDPAIVKAFIVMLGIYPVGTLVRLDTLELAIVHAANPVAEHLSRPIVRLISDDAGNIRYPGEVVDLADVRADGAFARTVIKTEHPERYGIRIGDYFV